MVEHALYIVSTPIGNLADITFRAVDILKSVSWVVAEDTRHSRTLFQHYGITTPLSACHAHNEHQMRAKVMQRLREGQSVALISDAGTPLINDPGYPLVVDAHAEGIAVIPVPGACAAIAALSAAGLPVDRFCFEGFLPAKEKARKARLAALQHEVRTLIFYEAPHRLVESLMTMVEQFGEMRLAVLARELTKRYETIRKASLQALLSWVLAQPEQQKGEIVLVISGYEPPSLDTLVLNHQEQSILDVLIDEVSPQQAARILAKLGERSKQEYYRFILNRNAKENKNT